MPRTAAHLPKWPKGVSGNPAGRPKDPISRHMREAAYANDGERSRKLTEMLWQLALAGDLKAAEILLNRIEGKAVDRQEQGEPGAFDAAAEIPDDALRRLMDLASKRKAS